MGSPRVEKMLTTQDREEITSTKNIIVSFFVEINICGCVHRPLYIAIFPDFYLQDILVHQNIWLQQQSKYAIGVSCNFKLRVIKMLVRMREELLKNALVNVLFIVWMCFIVLVHVTL